jgi:hypothetical protein
MEQLIAHLRQRFPLLDELGIGQETERPSPVPVFVRLLLAALDNAGPAGCCFVLPRKGQVGRLTAVLYALCTLKRNFGTYCASIQAPFKQGEFIRIHPGKHVFEFEGIDNEDPTQFWLGCKDGRRTFPRSQSFRIEGARGTRITGKGGPPIISVPKPTIDNLLKLESYGNLSFVPNLVLVLDIQNQFQQFTEGTTIHQASGQGVTTAISGLGIFGSVDENGALIGQADGSGGHPLVAVSSSIDLLLEACDSRLSDRAVVVINDLSILKSPQHFDTLIQRHNVIVLAEHSEWALVDQLRQRNCKVWPLTDFEIQLGQNNCAMADTRPGLFERVAVAAKNSAVWPETLNCKSPQLDAASGELEALNVSIKGEGREELRILTGNLFALLNKASGILIPPSTLAITELKAQVAKLLVDLERQRHWISPEDTNRVVQTCSLLNQAFDASTELGHDKREKFIAVLRELHASGRNKIGVLAKRESQFDEVIAVANQAGLVTQVFTAQPAFLPDEFFDAIVCVNWPGSDGFQRFFHRYLAPQIWFVGYEFEVRWLNQCRQKIRREAAGPAVNNEEKSAIIRHGPSVQVAWPGLNNPKEDTAQPALNEFSILVFEKEMLTARRGAGIAETDLDEKVPAKYVEFAGGKFAYITAGHKLPVATSLLLNGYGAPQRLPEREVAEWQVGDYMVFTHGQAEALQEIANRKMGGKAASLRQRARIWKEELRACNLSVTQIHKKLGEIGCTKTMTTIRNWIAKDSQIGPESKRDLEAIAEVTQSLRLKAEMDQVWSAIEEIWRYHLSAGTVLGRILVQKLPNVRQRIEETGTEIAIEDEGKHLGNAQIVKIDRIDAEFEQCSRTLVNRLRSEDMQLALLL